MKFLRFIVKGQMIKKDPNSPFYQMVSGSSNYYIAKFSMDAAWTGFACLAHFEADGAEEYVPIKYGKVIFPEKILQHKTFTVQVIGRKKDTILLTNKNKVIQIGGN